MTVPPQATTAAAEDLHERLAAQTGFNPELDDWAEWWRQQVAEALEAAAPHLAGHYQDAAFAALPREAQP